MKKNNTPTSILNTEKELNAHLLDMFGTNLKQAIKSTVSIMVRTEMEQLRGELDERLQFNGHYTRNLISPAGKVEDIPIARFRTGNDGYELKSMGLFAQEKERFYEVVANMHAVGISQRKVDAFCKRLFGKAAPPATTKQVFTELLEQEAFQINKRSLEGKTYDYLYLDGIWQTVQGTLTGTVKEQVVLAVSGYSVERDEHTFLGFRIADAEDEASWQKLLDDFVSRGLNLTSAKLLCMDGGAGLLAALESRGCTIPIQLCLTHRYRNVLAHTAKRNKKEMGKDLKGLTTSTSKEAFLRRAKAMEQKWHTTEERAMKSLKWNLGLSLTYFNFPSEHWRHIRTTNKLERSFREVRRRTVIQDHHFQSKESAERYMTAALAQAEHAI